MNVSLLVESSTDGKLVASPPAPGPFVVDDYFPNNEGCPPDQFQKWSTVGNDGSLTPVDPQSLPLTTR